MHHMAVERLGGDRPERAEAHVQRHGGALDALLRIIPISQILYGTDFQYRDGAEVNAGLAAYRFSSSERMAIDRDNALRMMPRLKG